MGGTWTGTVHRTVEDVGWPMRLMISIGFAGFLAAMGAVSFPLPWTPVPFSMIPFALLVAGAYQRPGWAGLSVAMYLVAGGLGAPIFAEGDSGFRHFLGHTAGYLFGFVIVSMLVSWYMQQRRSLLPRRWAAGMVGLVGLLVMGSLLALLEFQRNGTSLAAFEVAERGWGVGRSMLWVLLFLVVTTTTITLWALRQHRRQGVQALNLFLVMLAAIGILHTLGVVGLWLIGGYPLITSIIVGSVVFLPFDIIKAGLAVGLSLPFLPPLETSHA